jgi:predicted RNase H-like nuclease
MSQKPTSQSTQRRSCVLGIDVGWSKRKATTCAAILEWDGEFAELMAPVKIPSDPCKREKALKDFVGDRRFLAVAIDGPLCPGLSPLCEYRTAERILTLKFSQLGIGKPGQASSPNGSKLNQVASDFARLLKGINAIERAQHRCKIDDCSIVEAFPTSFLGVLLDYDRVLVGNDAKSDVFYSVLLGPQCSRSFGPPKENRLVSLVNRLLPKRDFSSDCLRDLDDHEHRAGAVCALTALCVARSRFTAVGDPHHGYIVLPPLAIAEQPGLQAWAKKIIERNIEKIPADQEKDRVKREKAKKPALSYFTPEFIDESTSEAGDIASPVGEHCHA